MKLNMPLTVPPDPHTPPSIIITFKKKLESLKTKAYCGREYILIDQLLDWLSEKEAGQPSTNVARLLIAAYEGQPYRKTDSIQLSQYCIVFCILVAHDYGHHIDDFQMASITDSRLNEDSSTDDQNLHRNLGYEAPKILHAFHDSRWAFCPARLQHNEHTTIRSQSQILPFCFREKINEGGTADVWQVIVKQEMLPHEMRQAMTQSLFEYPEHGMCYRFAIKCYAEKDRAVFKWEKEAFNILRGQAGMVQCFGSYELDEINEDYRRGQTARNFALILEYGERDLQDYLEDPRQIPPILPDEIHSFWHEMFKVAHALVQIHHAEYNNADSKEILSGWHADVKPDNILRVNGEFKLADFGFSKFKKAEPGGIIPSEYIDGGTFTYGAPEFELTRQRRRTRTNVTQTIDTWSYGCVLSEAATWLVLGYQGLEQYRVYRVGVIRDHRRKQRPQENGRHDEQLPRADDSFHNGYEVLPQIKEWHDYIRNSTRRTDTITHRVLTLVENHLLLKDPSLRYVSKVLFQELQAIKVEAEKEVQALVKSKKLLPMRPELQKRLAAIEQTARQSTLNSYHIVVPHDTEIVVTDRNNRDKGTALGPPQSKKYRKSQRAGKSEWIEKNALSRTAHRAPATIVPELPHLTESPRTYPTAVYWPKNESHREENDEELIPSPLIITPKTPYEREEGKWGVDNRSPQHKAQNAITLPPHATPSVRLNHNQDSASDQGNPSSQYTTVYNHTNPPKLVLDAAYLPAPGVSNLRKPRQPHRLTTPPSSPGSTVQRPEQAFTNQANLSISPPQMEPVGNAAEISKFSDQKEVSPHPITPTEHSAQTPGFYIKEYASLYDIKGRYPQLDIFTVRRQLDSNNPGLIGTWRAKPRNKSLINFISNRDIVFVVDNAPTMLGWWPLVSFTVETLAMNLTGLDKDGLDLIFTTSNRFNVENRRKDPPSKFRKQMELAKPDERSVDTDMAASLGIIFDDYIKSSQEKGKTLLVFTDGLWAGCSESDAVEKALVKFIKRTQDYIQGRQTKRRFSIEFIYFGNDPKAIDRLRALDDDIKNIHKLDDIVDHEPWTGDVEKMITGSFLEGKDAQQSDTGLSPPQIGRTDSNTPSIGSVASPTGSSRFSFFSSKRGKSIDYR